MIALLLRIATAAECTAVLLLDPTVQHIEEAPGVVLGASHQGEIRGEVIPVAILQRCGSPGGATPAAHLHHQAIHEKAIPTVAVLVPILCLIPGLKSLAHHLGVLSFIYLNNSMY
jgi:hypothetical protein